MLKFISTLLFISCIWASVPASHAQKSTVGDLEYLIVISGWWLNEKCRYLLGDLHQKFEADISDLKKALREKGWRETRFSAVRSASWEVVTKKPCNPEYAKGVVTAAAMTPLVRKRVLSGEFATETRAQSAFRATQFLIVSAAVEAEKICKFSGAKDRTTFRRLTDSLATKMPPQITEKGQQLQARIRNAGLPCNAQTERAVLIGFNEAKALGVDLGVWSKKTGLLPR